MPISKKELLNLQQIDFLRFYGFSRKVLARMSVSDVNKFCDAWCAYIKEFQIVREEEYLESKNKGDTGEGSEGLRGTQCPLPTRRRRSDNDGERRVDEHDSKNRKRRPRNAK